MLDIYRRLRVLIKQLLLIEPVVRVEVSPPLEFHGNEYCGWCIPVGSIDRNSVVVDVGLGEDVSFSKSLIDSYGCGVHGFDPTPRAIAYVKALGCRQLELHEFGVAAKGGFATFYLPNNDLHVSGSLVRENHVGQKHIEVRLMSIREVFDLLGAQRINLLKIDIEGAEYELISGTEFADVAARIDMLCIEFHHRWSVYGSKSTAAAVARLNALGFQCAWRARTTNEEFLFVNVPAWQHSRPEGFGAST
jgi:FkbM family methyltransferase